MMFQWKPDMIRFMSAASEYGDYNRRLAEIMLPYLTGREHLCDAGCGLGYLALELASHLRKVTAVDINQNALTVLANRAKKRDLNNLEIHCGDIFQLPPEMLYDAMVFCFYGHLSEILAIAKAQCRGRIFVFSRNYQNHRFSTGAYEEGADSRLRTPEELRRLGIPFETRELTLEFGQPFADMEDACLFFATYQRDGAAVEEAWLKEHLVPTGREDFPLYLPHRRRVRFLTFEAKDIP